jgi:transcription elongation factor Elf1
LEVGDVMGVIYIGNEERLCDYIDNPEVPTKCPVCRHTVIVNTYLKTKTVYEKDVGYCEVLFQCVNPKCNSLFIGKYKQYSDFSELYDTTPKTVEIFEVTEDIQKISPEFLFIYTQALQAEKQGLDKICGMGYRKALEFLIKDYLKYNITECSEYTNEQVENTALRNCIKQWIENPKIKSVSEKATILGNDETHYRRKWGDKDVADLKALIKLTINYIQMEIDFIKYENEIV